MSLTPQEELELLQLEEEDYQASKQSAQPSEPRHMKFTPDAPPSIGQRVENATLGVSQALPLGKVLAPVSAGIEQGIAQGRELLNPLLGESPTAQATLTKSNEQLANETRGILTQAEQSPEYDFGKLAGQIGLGAASGPTKAAQAAIGGVIGAAEGLNQGGIGGAAIGAVGGAGLGALFAAGPQAFKSFAQTSPIQAVKALGSHLQDLAGQLSVRILKLSKSDRNAFGVTGLKKLGEKLVSENFTTGFATLNTVASKVNSVVKSTGKQIRGIYSQLDKIDPTGLDAETLQKQLLDQVLAKDVGGSRASALGDLETNLQDYLSGSGKSNYRPSDLWDLAKNMEAEGRVWTSSQSAAENSKGQGLKTLARELRELVLGRAQQLNPELASNLQGANATFSELIDADHALQSTVATKQFGGQGLVPHSVGATLTNKLTGGTPARTATITALSKLGKGIEKEVEALPLRTLEQVWKLPKFAASKFSQILTKAKVRGPQATAALHHVLMQTQPEYRELYLSGDENGAK